MMHFIVDKFYLLSFNAFFIIDVHNRLFPNHLCSNKCFVSILSSLELWIDLCIVLRCYIVVNKKTNCHVVVLDELDSTIRDMAFECIILNQYGNFEKLASYSYSHADVTDLHGFTTIIVTIGGTLINFHLHKFVKWKHLRIENCSM
jgi:hypothetical protein